MSPSGMYDRPASKNPKHRFAEGTTVSSEKSRVEIERMLRKAGAESFGSGYQGTTARIQFMLRGLHCRFELQMPALGTVKQAEQEERRLWRALVLILKAKLEAINSGVSTFEEEFIGNIVVPNGQTVSEWLAPQIMSAMKTGKMPSLLLAAVGSK